MAGRDKHSRPQASELRIVLVGKTGAGKTSVMNTIFGRACLTSCSASSDTSECRCARGEILGHKLVVIDTPGVFNTKKTKEEVVREVVKCMVMAAPGPHVFLYVMQPNRFNREDYKCFQIIQRIFGKDFKSHALVLFTWADDEADISSRNKKSKLMQEFNGRYHCLDNTDTSAEQVSELLGKIEELVKKNRGRFYTNDMFKKAQEELEKEIVARRAEEATTSEAPPPADDDDVLDRVLATLLNLTMNKEMQKMVEGALGFLTEKADDCISQ